MPRACSYCGEYGHNRRSCKVLKGDVATISSMNLSYKQLFGNALKNSGLGTGAVVRRTGVFKDYNSEPNNYEIVAMITGVNWGQISLKYVMEDFVTGHGDTGYFDRKFLNARVIAIKFEDEESAKASREANSWRFSSIPKQNDSLNITTCEVKHLLKDAFPMTDFSNLGTSEKHYELVAPSGHVNPSEKFMTDDTLNYEIEKFFNFIVHGNSEWEKNRTHRVEKYIENNPFKELV